MRLPTTGGRHGLPRLHEGPARRRLDNAAGRRRASGSAMCILVLTRQLLDLTVSPWVRKCASAHGSDGKPKAMIGRSHSRAGPWPGWAWRGSSPDRQRRLRAQSRAEFADVVDKFTSGPDNSEPLVRSRDMAGLHAGTTPDGRPGWLGLRRGRVRGLQVAVGGWGMGGGEGQGEGTRRGEGEGSDLLGLGGLFLSSAHQSPPRTRAEKYNLSQHGEFGQEGAFPEPQEALPSGHVEGSFLFLNLPPPLSALSGLWFACFLSRWVLPLLPFPRVGSFSSVDQTSDPDTTTPECASSRPDWPSCSTCWRPALPGSTSSSDGTPPLNTSLPAISTAANRRSATVPSLVPAARARRARRRAGRTGSRARPRPTSRCSATTRWT